MNWCNAWPICSARDKRCQPLVIYPGGHLIGAQFSGYREVENLTPMHQSINDYHKGAWGSMEKQWAAALREGKTVQVKIELKYDDNTIRAAQFEVSQMIDGATKTRIVDNPKIQNDFRY